MKIVKSIEEIREISEKHRKEGKSIGLVPTMGYLHEGHRSLIEKAVKENDIAVVSVFVNPIQFCEGEDYEDYPRDLDRDSSICESAGVDYVFSPEVDTMYPEGFNTYVEPSRTMTNTMCALSRPGHFNGVCTVLTKLFNIVNPHRAYFGEKDIQQLSIVKRMVKDFNFNLEIKGCPIIREDDGLAKSSRNKYLDKEERKAATVLRRSLLKAKEAVENGENDCTEIRNIVAKCISGEKLAKADYIEVLDFDTFEKLNTYKRNVTLIGIAVYIGKTRLIDNILI